MKKRICLILLLISCAVSLGFISNTYSRYVAGTESNIDMLFAKWQVLVNNTDITSSNSSNITFNPIIEASNNVKSNTIAPTSKGYFDIEIDPTNVDVSFRYLIELEMDNEDMPDIMITKYAFLPDDYEDGDLLEYEDIVNGEIANDMLYDNESNGFDAFTIRVFFEWYDGEDETMDDDDDTAVGELAATDDTTLTITASLTFEQILDEDLIANVDNGENNENSENENE
ncbi:MAG: hypothetical protein J5892_01695 [Bacilli bacterium]|nr:hypothetical protein [Bacilli bacterium]